MKKLLFGFGLLASLFAQGALADPIFTARSTGQMFLLEREACRLVGKGEPQTMGFVSFESHAKRPAKTWLRQGDVARLDCRELKDSGFFLDPASVPDKRRVVVYDETLVQVINNFQGKPGYSVWISTLSGWWTLDRQGDLFIRPAYPALVVQVLKGDDTPYQQIGPYRARFVVGQEALLLNPDPVYTQLWEGMSECGYPSNGFMVLLRKKEDYKAWEALAAMFAEVPAEKVPPVHVKGCDASGLYNFVHPGDGVD